MADLKVARGTHTRSTAPPRSIFFQFHVVFGKIWQNRMLAPPSGEFAPLRTENPGSVPE